MTDASILFGSVEPPDSSEVQSIRRQEKEWTVMQFEQLLFGKEDPDFLFNMRLDPEDDAHLCLLHLKQDVSKWNSLLKQVMVNLNLENKKVSRNASDLLLKSAIHFITRPLEKKTLTTIIKKKRK